jgi:hypothetical protein
MLALLFKQPLNIWRSLELRYKIEAILLFILIYLYMATRLNIIIANWMKDGVTQTGVLLLISNSFTFVITLSSIFLLQWFMPKQKAINIFVSKPLDNLQVIKVLSYYSFKYLSVYIILLLPVLTAFIFKFGIYPVFFSIIIILMISYSFLLILCILQNRYHSGMIFILSGILFSLTYHGIFAFFYWWTSFAYMFQAGIVVFSAGFILFILKRNKQNALLLENFLGYKKKEIITTRIKYNSTFRIINIFPIKIQALFEKEVYSLWRNSYYKRMKIQSLLIFIFLVAFLVSSNIENREIWLVVLNCATIWLHYSNNFNEKYVISDPEWFIRTLPIRFRHLFLAKYFAEIAFVLVLFLCDLFLLPFLTNDLVILSYSLAFIFIFAHLVLFTMLNFQIMFYNSTRLAAYAYHFSLLFIVIMILNYRLVGPIIAIGLMIFFLYKNIKYFNN